MGYSNDSLIAGLNAASRVALGLAGRASLAGTYPDAESGLGCVAILEAAAVVAAKNHAYLAAGQGCPATARFEADGYAIVDPLATPGEPPSSRL